MTKKGKAPIGIWWLEIKRGEEQIGRNDVCPTPNTLDQNHPKSTPPPTKYQTPNTKHVLLTK